MLNMPIKRGEGFLNWVHNGTFALDNHTFCPGLQERRSCNGQPVVYFGPGPEESDLGQFPQAPAATEVMLNRGNLVFPFSDGQERRLISQ